MEQNMKKPQTYERTWKVTVDIHIKRSLRPKLNFSFLGLQLQKPYTHLVAISRPDERKREGASFNFGQTGSCMVVFDLI